MKTFPNQTPEEFLEKIRELLNNQPHGIVVLQVCERGVTAISHEISTGDVVQAAITLGRIAEEEILRERKIN